MYIFMQSLGQRKTTTCCSNVFLLIACLIDVPMLKDFQYLSYVACSMLFQHTQKSIIINNMLHLQC